MIIASVSIDLKKIDKSKINQHANGASYYSFDVIIYDEPNQYKQDVAVIQKQTKEEREAKVAKVYLGNGAVVFNKAKDGVTPSDGHIKNEQFNDDLPF